MLNLGSRNVFQAVVLASAASVFFGGIWWSLQMPDQITQITGFCSLIALTLLKMVWDSRVAANAERARTLLLKVVRAAQETGENTHKLVNSNFSTQLHLTALALRRIADLTGDPGDAEVASTAEADYERRKLG